MGGTSTVGEGRLERPESTAYVRRRDRSTMSLFRHDDHRFELSFVAEPKGIRIDQEIEVFMFFPKSMHLKFWKTDDFLADIRSYLRLSISTRGKKIQKKLNRLLGILTAKISESNFDPTIDCSDEIRKLGSLLSENLKALSEHNRNILSSKRRTRKVEKLRKEINFIRFENHKLIATIGKMRNFLKQSDLPGTSDLEYLDEYVTYLFTQHINHLRVALSNLISLSRYKKLHEELVEFLDEITELETSELHYVEEREFKSMFAANQDYSHEYRLSRLSQLKKYFQTPLFVDMDFHDPKKKFTDITAMVGAGIAASFVAAMNILTFNSYQMEITNRGMSLFCFAVIIYILKDRIKDILKIKLQKRLVTSLPDRDRHIYLRHSKWGRIKEWVKVIKKDACPKDILDLREEMKVSRLEDYSPEDILHYHRRFQLEFKDKSKVRKHYALKETVRWSVSRYLQQLDDPYKEHLVVDGEGKIEHCRSHRIYTMYAIVKSHFAEAKKDARFALYKISLDKNGIQNVSEVNVR